MTGSIGSSLPFSVAPSAPPPQGVRWGWRPSITGDDDTVMLCVDITTPPHSQVNLERAWPSGNPFGEPSMFFVPSGISAPGNPMPPSMAPSMSQQSGGRFPKGGSHTRQPGDASIDTHTLSTHPHNHPDDPPAPGGSLGRPTQSGETTRTSVFGRRGGKGLPSQSPVPPQRGQSNCRAPFSQSGNVTLLGSEPHGSSLSNILRASQEQGATSVTYWPSTSAVNGHGSARFKINFGGERDSHTCAVTSGGQATQMVGPPNRPEFVH